MTVAFHRLDQERQQRFQPLAADPVGWLTKHYQRISLSFLVIRRRVRRTEDCLISSEQAHRMLSMQARHKHKLVQNSRFSARLASL